MTPLEKAKAEEGRVNYCDECEQFEIVGNAAYCKVDGKLIHPIMMARGKGTGPAWNCKKRQKPVTKYDRLISKSLEELAEFIAKVQRAGAYGRAGAVFDYIDLTQDEVTLWLDWLKQEASDGAP